MLLDTPKAFSTIDPFLIFDVLAWFPEKLLHLVGFSPIPLTFSYQSSLLFFLPLFLWFLNVWGSRSQSLIFLKCLHTPNSYWFKDLNESHRRYVDYSLTTTKIISRMVFSLKSRFIYLIDYLKSLLTFLIVISNSVCSKLSFPCFFPKPTALLNVSILVNRNYLLLVVEVINLWFSSFSCNLYPICQEVLLAIPTQYNHNPTTLPSFFLPSCISLLKCHFLNGSQGGSSWTLMLTLNTWYTLSCSVFIP